MLFHGVPPSSINPEHPGVFAPELLDVVQHQLRLPRTTQSIYHYDPLLRMAPSRAIVKCRFDIIMQQWPCHKGRYFSHGDIEEISIRFSYSEQGDSGCIS